MAGWASLDSPWAHMVKAEEFGQALARIRQLAPKLILSAHLPSATGKIGQFLEWLAQVPPASPAMAPNQAALEQILAQMGAGR